MYQFDNKLRGYLGIFSLAVGLSACFVLNIVYKSEPSSTVYPVALYIALYLWQALTIVNKFCMMFNQKQINLGWGAFLAWCLLVAGCLLFMTTIPSSPAGPWGFDNTLFTIVFVGWPLVDLIDAIIVRFFLD